MNIKYRTYQLELANPFGLSRSVRTEVPSFVIIMEHEGFVGLGECTVNPFYQNSLKSFQQTLDKYLQALTIEHWLTPEEYWLHIYGILKGHEFLLCAIDQAYWDLYSQFKKSTTRNLLGLGAHTELLSNYTIGLDEIPVMLRKMKDQPWPLYKIKLGSSQDLEILRALRSETNAVFRVDANCGWTVNQVLDWQDELIELGVEFIEQPLKVEDVQGAKVLFENSKIPIIADESCLTIDDVAICHDQFHGINIKLMKCGGMTPALQMIHKARALGMKVMMGCMTESSVGIAAIAQFASALDYIDLDGAMLIKNDPADGVKLEQGHILYPNRLGNGARLF
ncbi:dipeptide epimerase [Flavobacteriaceae bacterium]|nr:dipeptide epimerase [Flavobacteriaceae bacterium]